MWSIKGKSSSLATKGYSKGKSIYNFSLGNTRFSYQEFSSSKKGHPNFRPSPAWKAAPLLDIHKFIKDIETNMPKDAHFSLLDPAYITRNITEIREIFSAIGIQNHDATDTNGAARQLRNLVVFKPERLLLHEVIVQATTQLQIENDNEFKAIVRSLYEKAKQEVQNKNKEFDKAIEYFQDVVKQEISNNKDNYNNSFKFTQLVMPIFKTVAERARDKKYIPGKYIHDETVDSVVSKIIADDLIRKHLAVEINTIVTSHIEEILKLGQFTQLPLYSSSMRQDIFIALTRYTNIEKITFMVAGGPASGKGILTERIAAMLKDNQMEIKNFAMIAPDRYKIVLGGAESLGKDQSYHGTLTQEECRLIAENCRDRIMEMLKLNHAPNTFIEMLVPYEDKVELGTYDGGKFRVYVASADPILAVEGSFKRFQEIGRFVPKEYVLEGQKRVSAYIPKFIRENQNKYTDIRLEIHDTTGAFDDPAAKYRNPVAIIEPSINSVTLFDISKMFDFLKKEDINPNAKSPEEVYAKSSDVKELAKKLKEDYGKGIIIFVDPREGIDHVTQQEKIYALFDGETGYMEITNPEIFDIMLRDNLYKETFQLLDSTVGNSVESTLKNREGHISPRIS